MDAKRRIHSCQFAFIRGSKVVWAGWINDEMNINGHEFEDESFVSIRVYFVVPSRSGLVRLTANGH
jgi:hypothetical protein